MKKHLTFFLSLIALATQAQIVSDFETLLAEPDTFLNGSDMLGGFRDGNVFLPNDYTAEFESWTGWAISNKTDSTTPGFMNQYSAITGTGAESSSTYAVSFSFGPNVLKFEGDTTRPSVLGLYITNSTYAYLSMRDGDAFAKKFGGSSGDDPDYFLLTIKGYLGEELQADSIDFYLADFRFEDNSQDYIVKEWTFVDLSSMGAVDSLSFSLSSTDVGQFGMNTPAYFCIDKVETAGLSTGLFSNTKQTLSLKVFPNPAQDVLYFDEKLAGKVNISIYTLTGSEVRSTILMNGNPLDLSYLNPGTYFLRVSAHGKVGSILLSKE